MTAQPISARPAALAEPTVPVTARWTWLYSLAVFAFYTVNWGAASILAPKLAERVSEDDGVAIFGAFTAIGMLTAAVAAPIVGALSDRTTSRWGRRHPWILATTLGTAAMMVALSVQTSLVVVLLLAPLAVALPQCALTALSALVPDDVPAAQRATVSAWAFGLAAAVGLLAGAVLVSVVVTSVTGGFLVAAIVLVVLTVPFVWLTRGVPLAHTERPSTSLRHLLGSLRFSPRQHPDFAWALTGRFCFFLANGLGTAFLYFFLRDAVHDGDPTDPAVGVLVLTAIYVAFASLSSVPVGRLSDRLRSRKRITMISASFQGVACLVLALSQSWPAAIAGAVLLGCGFGVYAAVDQALVSEVLPAAGQRAKDLGIITVAASVAGAAAALIGPVVIDHAGGYPALYLLACVMGLLSAAMVQPIKSVR